MTVPDWEKYGYEPEEDSPNLITYVNRGHSYGLPYRIGASPDGEGGWGVWVQWERGADPVGDPTTKYGHVEGDLHNYTSHQSQREKRFGAAMMIERAMEEYSEDNYGPDRGGGDFNIGGGL